jgi:hypothetical protein
MSVSVASRTSDCHRTEGLVTLIEFEKVTARHEGAWCLNESKHYDRRLVSVPAAVLDGVAAYTQRANPWALRCFELQRELVQTGQRGRQFIVRGRAYVPESIKRSNYRYASTFSESSISSAVFS